MVADTQVLENLLDQAKQLSPEYRLRLVQNILQTLITPTPITQPRPIRFGEFSGDKAVMSTLEDFAIAEWRPTDEDLDGP